MTALRIWIRAHWPHHKTAPLPRAFNPEIGYTTDTDISEGDSW
jgi:hypothetical protein